MAVKRQKTVKPVSVGVRVYNVGLGDCFLLTFKTKSGAKIKEHRILIDFGSTGRNKADGPTLQQVADQIVQDCGGKNSELDALVITHRHQDHMSGFGGKPGLTLTSQLRPKIIIQPWTEEPGADNPLQMGTTDSHKAAAQYVFSLNAAQYVTDSILNEVLVRREKGMDRPSDNEAVFYCQKNLPFALGRTLKKVTETDDDEVLQGVNTDTIANVDAISNIQKWSWKRGTKLVQPKRVYLEKDSPLNLSVPGLKVTVLGPVGPDQWESLKKHANEDELWRKLQALRSDNGQTDDTSNGTGYVKFDAGEGAYGVPSIFMKDDIEEDGELRKDNVRWLVENLDQLRGEQLLGFVRVLDEHINNTSVVLLLEFGGFRMLFPGDAEVAAWQAIVEDGKAASELKNIDLYKVGHHGSNNATPRESLWQKLVEDRDEEHPLHCVLSTQTTKFSGSIPNKTLFNTMLNSNAFHLISTACPKDSDVSQHADDWKVHEQGTGNKRIVISYSREFDV